MNHVVRRHHCVIIVSLLCFLLVDYLPAWQSNLYDATWNPNNLGQFYSDKLIQDFSHAGYHRGQLAIPDVAGPIYNVLAYGADPSGAANSTNAIQNAINAAQSAGGGVVYLPTGTYLVALNGNSCLRITQSNIVLRGDGPDRTFLCNSSYLMRSKLIIYAAPQSVTSWSTTGSDNTAISQNLTHPTNIIPVTHPSRFATGDWVILRNTITDDWINEHLEPEWLGYSLEPILYCRQVAAVNTSNNTITIDVPIRYSLLTRDNATVYNAPTMLSEVGLEDFSIANLQHPGSSFASGDYNVAGTAAYDVHDSFAIKYANLRNSWIRNVHSYLPPANSSTCHILSNGILLYHSRGITLDNCSFQRPQYGGGGGNGYMFRIMANENLLKDCQAQFSRHGFVFSHMCSSGNVFLRCSDRRTARATGASGAYTTDGSGSDHHMHFSQSNLIDSCTADESYFAAAYRHCGTPPLHNLTAAHSVYWNMTSQGNAYSYCINTQQSRYGYAIGTRGASPNVNAPEYSKTNPIDHVEGTAQGATLQPQSLYAHQIPLTNPPTAPGQLLAVAGDHAVDLYWTTNLEPDIDHYNIYRSTSPAGPFSLIATNTDNHFSDLSAQNHTTYYYYLSASDTGARLGPRSSKASSTPLPGGTQPVILARSCAQYENEARNILDGNTADSSRWSAAYFPQWTIIDYTTAKWFSATKLWTYQHRAYQFTIEASNSPFSNYRLIVDRSANTSGAQPITDSFTPQTARYIKITITDASGYTGDWSSLTEFALTPSRTGDLTGEGEINLKDLAILNTDWPTLYNLHTLSNLAENWLQP